VLDKGLRTVVGTACAYEVFALATGKVPTISAFCRRHRSVEAVILLGLLAHFHYELKELDASI
jgi:hypothetical protein